MLLLSMFFFPSFRFSLRLRVLLPLTSFPRLLFWRLNLRLFSLFLESAVVSGLLIFSEVAVLVAGPRVFAPVSVAGPEAVLSLDPWLF